VENQKEEDERKKEEEKEAEKEVMKIQNVLSRKDILVFSSIILSSIILPAIIPSLFLGLYLNFCGNFVLLPVFVVVLIFLYAILTCLFCGFLSLKIKVIEGEFKNYTKSKNFLNWQIKCFLYGVIRWVLNFLPITIGLKNYIAIKVLGGKLGINVLCVGDVMEPYLIEIGDNSIVGVKSLICPHLIEGNKLILKRIKIGKNVVIGANSIIFPGAVIEDNVIVGANSLVPKNKKLEGGWIYVGNPVKKFKKLG